MIKNVLTFIVFTIPQLVYAKNEEVPNNWEKDLDTFFGEYVVSPLAKLLFWPIPGIEIPLVVAWLLGGALFFTLRMRFVNIRLFKHAIDLVRGKYDNSEQNQ